ncbi:alanine:cation symporter family protein [Virgibacillus halophilus]|uniref:Alanine:cation symporter family protein n=1 Tax=Tigheibacillus halophilus TaxID=361280 RepID=A0ABU5C5K0_9BACI|nr:alanine:cation symporter family protein [Virgibacillus halophilus]
MTPFQAFTSSLGTTAGATNIVGVAIAIALGGPGALFLDVGSRSHWHGDKICRNCPWSSL